MVLLVLAAVAVLITSPLPIISWWPRHGLQRQSSLLVDIYNIYNIHNIVDIYNIYNIHNIYTI